MLNQALIVGRIVEIFDDEILVKTPRSYKNEQGEYDYDVFPCIVGGSMMSNVKEYCSLNDIVGVKGRLESDGAIVKIKAEKISFLSSHTNIETNDEGGE